MEGEIASIFLAKESAFIIISIRSTDSIRRRNKPNIFSYQKINIAPSYTMSIKIGASSFMDELHSCESILPALNLLNDRAMCPKTLSIDAPYCIDAVTRHPKIRDQGH